VLQDTWLFKGTVRENLCYNCEDVSDEKIMEVCRIIGIDNFIITLPKGLDTELDNKNRISAGQRQLFTIARSMLKDSPFLILDEATSSVDTRTEELVQKAMDRLSANKTSFIIAHRLSTIRNADLILVMRDGDIVEQGTHDELLARNGFYAELYNAQFEKIEAA
jgi:ATP-binding cassette subfamily B protein